mmetsp:Transcript_1241/g.2648  ORF Transcript_1241/g.2648 Transcript_1241/m.2648 type:complete len:225 (+) Transcript_1241:272-946(+)
MLPHRPIPMIFERTKVMTRPCRLTVPMITLVSLPLNLPRHTLGQKHILILSTIIAPLTDDGRLDRKLPSAFLGKVFGIRRVIKGHLQAHVVRHGIGTGYPSHQGIVPRFGSLTLILKRNDPLRFLLEGRLTWPLGLFLFDDHPFFVPFGSQWDLIFVGWIKGVHLRLVIGKDRVRHWSGHGKYSIGVDGMHLLVISLNFRLLFLEVGLGFVVFGVMLGDGEGFC